MAHARELLHSPARKKRKRMRRMRIAAVVGTGLFLVLGVVAGFAHINQIRIAAIDVSGTRAVSADDIRAKAAELLSGSYALIFPKNNAFLYPKSELLASLAGSFPGIKSISVGTKGLTDLSIAITERTPVGAWCGDAMATSTSCYLVDDTGFLYAPGNKDDEPLAFYGPLPVASTTKSISSRAAAIGNYFLQGSAFTNLLTLRILLNHQDMNVVAYEAGAADDYSAYLETGGKILFNNTASADDIARAVGDTISAKQKGNVSIIPSIDYIDARFLDTGKVFLKLK